MVKSRGFAFLGWGMIWIGILLLLMHSWQLAWSILAIMVALSFIVRAFREPEQRTAILPGTILLVTAAVVLVHQQQWMSFAMWRIWPIFFFSVGLGLVLLWGMNAVGRWIFVPGGLLMFVGGLGLASPSWYLFLRQLRSIYNYWPIILILIGIAFWQSRRSV